MQKTEHNLLPKQKNILFPWHEYMYWVRLVRNVLPFFRLLKHFLITNYMKLSTTPFLFSCLFSALCLPAFVLPSILIRRIWITYFFWGAVSSWFSCGSATSTDRFCFWCLVDLSQHYLYFQCLQKTRISIFVFSSHSFRIHIFFSNLKFIQDLQWILVASVSNTF